MEYYEQLQGCHFLSDAKVRYAWCDVHLSYAGVLPVGRTRSEALMAEAKREDSPLRVITLLDDVSNEVGWGHSRCWEPPFYQAMLTLTAFSPVSSDFPASSFPLV